MPLNIRAHREPQIGNISKRILYPRQSKKKLRQQIFGSPCECSGCDDDDPCDCKGCFHECGSMCKCGSNCKNKMIQTAVPLKTRLFDTRKIGFGVITDVPLKKGICLGQYVGEVITLEKYSHRIKSDQHLYGYQLKNSFVIDARNKGNKGSQLPFHHCRCLSIGMHFNEK